QFQIAEPEMGGMGMMGMMGRMGGMGAPVFSARFLVRSRRFHQEGSERTSRFMTWQMKSCNTRDRHHGVSSVSTRIFLHATRERTEKHGEFLTANGRESTQIFTREGWESM